MKDPIDSLPEGFEADRLPVLPHVLLRVARACRAPELDYHELAGIINQDPTLAGRIVAAANAASLRQTTTVSSVDRALLVLGTETIKTIVITQSVRQVFESFTQIPEPVYQAFWRRSLTAALWAKAIATLTSFPYAEDAYLAGLLHNIGELVMGVQYGERFFDLLSQLNDDEEQIRQEQAEFGHDHVTAGTCLALHWCLDGFLVDAIRYHHLPTAQVLDAQHLTKLVHLGSSLSAPGQLTQDRLLAADQLFGLMPPLVQEIGKRIEGEVEQLAANLGIQLENSLHSVQRDLADEIKVISLLQTAKAHLVGTEDGPAALVRVRQAAEILFQTSQSLLFFCDAEGRALICQPRQQDPALELRIQIQPDRSLVTDALLRRELNFWWPEQEQKPFRVIDRQVLDILQSPGLACLPLRQGDQLQGVLVLGIKQPLSADQRQLMELFAAEAVLAVAPQLMQPVSTSAPIEGVEGELQRLIRETVHEANNPLTIVRNYLEVLARKLNPEHEAQQDLEVIREEVDRTARILLTLSQNSQGSTMGGLVQINQLTAQVVQLFRNSLFATRSIECVTDFAQELPPIETDEAALRQVLTNLLKNAAEALPPGGTVWVATRDQVNLNGKTFIAIVVSDNGPGLPAAVMEKLYQPGHSTKGDGHGGLGLSIVRNLVESAGGLVSCQSSSAGTEFQLLLPRK